MTTRENDWRKEITNISKILKNQPRVIRAQTILINEAVKKENYELANILKNEQLQRIKTYTNLYIKNHPTSLNNIVYEAYDILEESAHCDNSFLYTAKDIFRDQAANDQRIGRKIIKYVNYILEKHTAGKYT